MDASKLASMIASIATALEAHAASADSLENVEIVVSDGVVSVLPRADAACSVLGCTKFAKIRGHCIVHWSQRDTDDCASPRSPEATETSREPTMSPCVPPTNRVVCKAKPAPATRMCKTPGCQSYARRYGRCSRHGGASMCQVTGQCKVGGCTTFARLHGYCLEHYEETLKQAVMAKEC
ncbi:hypothetical protein ACHHYP_10265 [Achlya hypogyna]|uniref:Uncharacterized protein n=1 Tax=Achlya hypogyna TaxID=1202772 RepID=A0A1V9YLW5_ACHHY|nr:hypothetical protein ACHHYP_10265 [Achlya hypogyna]